MIYNFPHNKIEYKIGIISDTHGLLRPSAIKALQGSDLIIHAGDIGDKIIIDKLKLISPVAAVRGNIDNEPWSFKFPLAETIKVNYHSIFIIHNICKLNIDPLKEGIDAVIYGHSHKPLIEKKNGVLFINPGSAGRKRFNLPVSAGRIIINKNKITAQTIMLE